MNNDELYDLLNNEYQKAKDKARSWRAEASLCYSMYSSNQWADEVRYAIESSGRPCLTLNMIRRVIDTHVGIEIAGRRSLEYLPRTLGQAVPCDLMTSAVKWFFDSTNAQFVDTLVYTDVLVAGMGWVNISTSFENAPEGKPYYERMDPLCMLWDYRATKNNLEDAQYLFYEATRSVEDWKDILVDVDDDDFLYGLSQDKSQATIVECRYKVKEKYYYGINPLNGEPFDVDRKTYNQYKRIWNTQFENEPIDIQVAVYPRVVVKKAYLGGKRLLKIEGGNDEVLAPVGRFGWECMTGHYNHDDKQFYGLVRDLIDKQNMLNKSVSKLLEAVSLQAGGGLLVEEDAFVDKQRALRDLSNPSSVVECTPGALREGKIQPKIQTPIPESLSPIISMMMNQIKQSVGLNDELMGQRNAVQSAALESQRKAASLSATLGLHDSFIQYRLSVGKQVLYIIKEVFSDGRLIKVLGEEGYMEYQQLGAGNLSAEYDVIISENDMTPLDKARALEDIQKVLPFTQGAFTNEMALQYLLRLTSIPSTLQQKLLEVVKAQQSDSTEKAEQQQIQKLAAEEEIRYTIAKRQSEEANAQVKVASAEQMTQNAIATSLANERNLRKSILHTIPGIDNNLLEN